MQYSPVLPDPSPRWPRRAATALAVALLLGLAALNLAQFRSIDAGVDPHFKAAYRYHTPDLIELSYQELAWAKDRYGLGLALSAVAPGATVLVPTPGSHDGSDDAVLDDLIWLRWATNGPRLVPVEVSEAAVVTLAGLDPAAFAIASGKGSTRGLPWLLAIDPAVGPAGDGDPATFVRRLVAGGDLDRPAAATDREFVLLRIPVGGVDHDVLIETSLLPAQVRAELRP